MRRGWPSHAAAARMKHAATVMRFVPPVRLPPPPTLVRYKRNTIVLRFDARQIRRKTDGPPHIVMWPCADSGSTPAVEAAPAPVRVAPTLNDMESAFVVDAVIAEWCAPIEVPCDECGRPVPTAAQRCPTCVAEGVWICERCHDEVLRRINDESGGGAAACA